MPTSASGFKSHNRKRVSSLLKEGFLPKLLSYTHIFMQYDTFSGENVSKLKIFIFHVAFICLDTENQQLNIYFTEHHRKCSTFLLL